MESIGKISKKFVDEYDNTYSLLEFYKIFIENNAIDCENYGNAWDLNNSIIIALPLEFQLEMLEEYFTSSDAEYILDLSKVIYYWHYYFEKSKDIQNIKLLDLKEKIEFYIKKKVGRFTHYKFLSLIFLKYPLDDIFSRNFYNSQQIDSLLIGLLYSNLDVWNSKIIIDKIIKNAIHYEESFDVLSWIFYKYKSYGIDIKKIFGSIVDIVDIVDMNFD